MTAKTHAGRLARLVLLIAIFSLGRLHETVSPHTYLWLLTGLAVVCAGVAMRRGDEDVDVERYLSRRER
jgi:hypothetical protein